MKSLGFFLTVFLSMLAVFLLATGEVKRWFADTSHAAVFDPLETGAPKSLEPEKNIFEFPFYDVERAKLKFIVRAEFSQEEFPDGTPIEDITNLTLRNGTIRVPISGGPTEDDAEGGQPTERNLLLEFTHAIYRRKRDGGGGRAPLEVLLRDGKGTTEDGTQLFFEELIFRESGPDSYSLLSTKPVSIHNPSFGVTSPAGLEGSLKEEGVQSFTLLPPVTTLMDPSRSLSLVTGRKETDGDAAPAAEEPPEGDVAEGTKAAVVCSGPMTIFFEKRDREATPPTNASTIIGFHKDVIVYSVAHSIALASVPAPQGNRFECQYLEVELEHTDERMAARRAVATWDGGRVRAFVHPEGEGEPYRIDGDRLEWHAEEGDPAAESDGETVAMSEAVLHGSPRMVGNGLRFDAERAVFRVHEDRVLLESVRGTMEYEPPAGDAKDGSDQRPDAAVAPADWREKLPENARPPTEERREKPSKPQHWELAADEVELLFDSGEGNDPGRKRFSKFVARSKGSPEVVVSGLLNQPPEQSSAEAGGQAPGAAATFTATGRTLTYVQRDRLVTLEGSGDAKPRFLHGENSIRARTIHILQESHTARFEGEVEANIKSATALDPEASPPLQGPGEGKSTRPTQASPQPGSRDLAFDLEADSLSVRFRANHRDVRDLVARGSPVRVTTRSTPWCRFEGPELFWDQAQETAWLQPSSEPSPEHPRKSALPTADETPGPIPVVPPQTFAARLEVEEGELLADRVIFQARTWKAYLADRAVLRGYGAGGRTDPQLEVRTGKAEVEFFEGFEEKKSDRSGLLQELGFIKSLVAHSPPEGFVEVRGRTFVGRAEQSAWDSESRELRFFGSGMQEIELVNDEFRGPIRSREIVYEETNERLRLEGNVHGELLQATPALPAGRAAEPAAQPRPAGFRAGVGAMRWEFSTTSLDVQLRQVAGSNAPQFESLSAHDKVDLRNAERGIHFRGDELVYENASRKVHIFSPDGRPQILVFDRLMGGANHPSSKGKVRTDRRAELPGEKVHKIAAQELWLLLYENPRAVKQRGERAEWLLVQFERDVNASFYIPDRGKKLKGVGDLWKMASEKLTLYVDPSQPVGGDELAASKVIPWARASGKVVFTSGTYQATGDNAIYEDPHSRVTLYGSPRARLFRDNRLIVEAPALQLLQVEGRPGLKYDTSNRLKPRLPLFR